MADRRDLSYRERRRLASEAVDEMASREREARRRQQKAEEKVRDEAEKERAAVGLVPLRVVRTALGPLRLDGLAVGQSRALSWQEPLVTISQGGRR